MDRQKQQAQAEQSEKPGVLGVLMNIKKWCTACIEETAGRIEVRYMATVIYIARSVSL